MKELFISLEFIGRKFLWFFLEMSCYLVLFHISCAPALRLVHVVDQVFLSLSWVSNYYLSNHIVEGVFWGASLCNVGFESSFDSNAVSMQLLWV